MRASDDFRPGRKEPRRSDSGRPAVATLLVVGVLVFLAAYLGGTPVPGTNGKVFFPGGHFIGGLQLFLAVVVGYVIGKMRSLGELAPDEDEPTFSEKLRALAKSDVGKKWCGVCAGFGEHTPLPAWLWRVAFLLTAFINGFGLLAYVILAFALPEAGDKKETPETSAKVDEAPPFSSGS